MRPILRSRHTLRARQLLTLPCKNRAILVNILILLLIQLIIRLRKIMTVKFSDSSIERILGEQAGNNLINTLLYNNNLRLFVFGLGPSNCKDFRHSRECHFSKKPRIGANLLV